jgi:hypothetical protein
MLVFSALQKIDFLFTAITLKMVRIGDFFYFHGQPVSLTDTMQHMNEK